MKNLFPSIMILLQSGQAVVCFFAGDRKRAIYWIAACLIVWSVSW